jgi:hypothetical protein
MDGGDWTRIHRSMAGNWVNAAAYGGDWTRVYTQQEGCGPTNTAALGSRQGARWGRVWVCCMQHARYHCMQQRCGHCTVCSRGWSGAVCGGQRKEARMAAHVGRLVGGHKVWPWGSTLGEGAWQEGDVVIGHTAVVCFV